MNGTKKLSLDPAALAVQGFATHPADADDPRGTVEAHAATRRLCTGQVCEETRYTCPAPIP